MHDDHINGVSVVCLCQSNETQVVTPRNVEHVYRRRHDEAGCPADDNDKLTPSFCHQCRRAQGIGDSHHLAHADAAQVVH